MCRIATLLIVQGKLGSGIIPLHRALVTAPSGQFTESAYCPQQSGFLFCSHWRDGGLSRSWAGQNQTPGSGQSLPVILHCNHCATRALALEKKRNDQIFFYNSYKYEL
uniref:Uncharacterized protein n=1 Tax=Micrurus carvalhoi TaxID=3147026 RepID=A0A2H6MUK7_9SAUR